MPSLPASRIRHRGAPVRSGCIPRFHQRGGDLFLAAAIRLWTTGADALVDLRADGELLLFLGLERRDDHDRHGLVRPFELRDDALGQGTDVVVLRRQRAQRRGLGLQGDRARGAAAPRLHRLTASTAPSASASTGCRGQSEIEPLQKGGLIGRGDGGIGRPCNHLLDRHNVAALRNRTASIDTASGSCFGLQHAREHVRFEAAQAADRHVDGDGISAVFRQTQLPRRPPPLPPSPPPPPIPLHLQLDHHHPPPPNSARRAACSRTNLGGLVTEARWTSSTAMASSPSSVHSACSRVRQSGCAASSAAAPRSRRRARPSTAARYRATSRSDARASHQIGGQGLRERRRRSRFVVLCTIRQIRPRPTGFSRSRPDVVAQEIGPVALFLHDPAIHVDDVQGAVGPTTGSPDGSARRLTRYLPLVAFFPLSRPCRRPTISGDQVGGWSTRKASP